MKKRISKVLPPFAIKIAAGICSAVLLCTGGYFTVEHFTEKQKSRMIAQPTKEAVRNIQTAAPKSAAPAAATIKPEMEKKGEFQVLTRVRRKDGNDFTYKYSKDAVTATDQDGRIVFKIEFDQNGKIRKRMVDLNRVVTTDEFDENGRIMKSFYKNYRDMEEVRTYTNYEYDPEGHLIKESHYDANDTLLQYRDYAYDAAGFLKQDTLYTAAGEEQEINRYEQGRRRSSRTIESYRNSYGSTDICCDHENFYDSDGNAVKTHALYEISSECDAWITCLYNTAGYEIGYERVQKQSKFMHLTGTVRDNTRLMYYSYDFAYDDDGMLVPALYYGRADAGGVVITPYIAKHTLKDTCVPEYGADGKLRKCTCDEEYGYDSYWAECEFDDQERKVKEVHHYFGTGLAVCLYAYNADGSLQKIVEVDRETNAPKREFIYDAEGRICKYITYTERNAEADFTYDITGKPLITCWNFTAKEGNRMQQSVKYDYDRAGKRIGTTYYFYNNDGSSQAVAYDADGRIVKESQLAADQTVISWVDYLYADLGELLKKICYAADGAVISWTEYVYNDQGMLLDWNTYTQEGKIRSGVACEYDDKGNLTYKETYSKSGLPEYGIRYDRNGHVIQYNVYPAAAEIPDSTQYNVEYIFEDADAAAYQTYSLCKIEDLILES